MLLGGIMITIGGVNNTGNDTYTLPSLIAMTGAIFTFWGFYHTGYMKAGYDSLEGAEKKANLKTIVWQVAETIVYLIITIVGLLLLLNQNFTNRLMNLITGGLTIFNGAIGIIKAIKNRANYKSFGWIFMTALSVTEIILGILFVILADSISQPGFIVMGIITVIAGIIEVGSALTKQVLKDTVRDGKEILKALRED